MGKSLQPREIFDFPSPLSALNRSTPQETFRHLAQTGRQPLKRSSGKLYRPPMLERIKARILFLPTLFWNMLLGRWLKVRNWSDRIDPSLILGALPLESDVPGLAEQGVTAVVNTCEEYAGPVDAYEKHGITQLHIPTTDFTHPSLDAVTRAVAFIDRQADAGGSVYVHCKAGRARSATVALCWLVHRYGMTPEQAQALLIEKRPHVNRLVYARPVVKAFVEQDKK